jgi:hypothetical protein
MCGLVRRPEYRKPHSRRAGNTAIVVANRFSRSFAMTKKNSRMLIPLADFERIFRIIDGMLLNERGDRLKACTFYNIIGAEILRTHYRLEARPVAGFAAYKLDESNDVLTFATTKDGAFITDNDAFHCWVQCEDWFLDFTSPLFEEIFAAAGSYKHYERKMFQKRRTGMCILYSELREPSDFLYEENPELTKSIVKIFFSMQPYKDILNICVDWHRRTPNKMQEVQNIWDAAGQVKETRLSPLVLTGAW